jgi:hypothetical protein
MKHEIIYTDNYALILSDEKVMEGDCYLSPYGIFYFHNHLSPEEYRNAKKIIAQRPLSNAFNLKGVALLPDWTISEEELLVPFTNSTQTGRLRDGSEIKTWMLGWEEGFKEAKETYKYTEEDLRECCSLIFNALGVGDDITTDEIIQHIQQPKRPKYFECEMEDYGQFDCDVFMKDGEEPKTITNSQGQTELVGEYTI